MKTERLVLVAPDFAALDRIARRSAPAVLWPVGGQSLAAHWLDHAVRLGCRHVVLHVLDRPAEVRAALGDGGYWSLAIEVSTQPPPADAIRMDRLPGEPARAAPTTPAELVTWWWDLNRSWLERRNAAAISIDERRADGGWVGPGVRIDPSAQTIAPYWIGAGTEVGPGCRIGPGAMIGPGCVLEQDVRIENSLVLPRTFLGRHLDVVARMVDGPVVLDRVSGTRVEIADTFVASSLAAASDRVAWSERLVAALLWLPAWLWSRLAGPTATETVLYRGQATLALTTGSRGPLLARRARWLRHVVAGRLRLVGVLPRPALPELPADSEALLANVRPGAFAWSDLHGSHSAADPDEAVHAAYQVAVPATNRRVWRNLIGLCTLRPGAAQR